MDHPAYRIVGTLGTIVTAVSVIDWTKGWVWSNVILFVIAGYSAVFFVRDTWQSIRAKPIKFDLSLPSGPTGIANHLVEQLTASQRVAIMSRDLTWVTENSEALDVLRQKAKKGQLSAS